MGKFLDQSGVAHLWSKIKSNMAITDNETQKSVPGILMSLKDFEALTPEQKAEISENAFVLCYKEENDGNS